MTDHEAPAKLQNLVNLLQEALDDWHLDRIPPDAWGPAAGAALAEAVEEQKQLHQIAYEQWEIELKRVTDKLKAEHDAKLAQKDELIRTAEALNKSLRESLDKIAAERDAAFVGGLEHIRDFIARYDLAGSYWENMPNEIQAEIDKVKK